MPKKKPTKRITRANRAEIMATAKAKGWTAEQVARKYGVSKWTYYGWKKRGSGGAKTTTRPGNTGRKTSGASGTREITPAALQSEIRAILPTLLREEIYRTLMGVVGRGTTVKRRRRGGKK